MTILVPTLAMQVSFDLHSNPQETLRAAKLDSDCAKFSFLPLEALVAAPIHFQGLGSALISLEL